jgi:hypothetical protein
MQRDEVIGILFNILLSRQLNNQNISADESLQGTTFESALQNLECLFSQMSEHPKKAKIFEIAKKIRDKTVKYSEQQGIVAVTPDMILLLKMTNEVVLVSEHSQDEKVLGPFQIWLKSFDFLIEESIELHTIVSQGRKPSPKPLKLKPLETNPSVRRDLKLEFASSHEKKSERADSNHSSETHSYLQKVSRNCSSFFFIIEECSPDRRSGEINNDLGSSIRIEKKVNPVVSAMALLLGSLMIGGMLLTGMLGPVCTLLVMAGLVVFLAGMASRPEWCPTYPSEMMMMI